MRLGEVEFLSSGQIPPKNTVGCALVPRGLHWLLLPLVTRPSPISFRALKSPRFPHLWLFSPLLLLGCSSLLLPRLTPPPRCPCNAPSSRKPTWVAPAPPAVQPRWVCAFLRLISASATDWKEASQGQRSHLSCSPPASQQPT